MAKLPSAADLGTRPTPQPQGGIAQYNIAGGGEAEGLALVKQGEMLGHESDKFEVRLKHEKEKADTLAAEDAFTKLREKQIDLTIGQDGFVNKKGAAAVAPKEGEQGLMPAYTDRYRGAVTEIASTLTNPDQVRLFGHRAAVAGLQYKEDILRHMVQQGAVYSKEVYDGTIAVEVKNATSRWNEPNSLALSFERVEAAVRQQAEVQGWAPEFKEAARLDALSKLNSSVIDQALANKNFVYAEEWFKAHKGEIDPQTSARLSKAVEDGHQKQQFNGYQSGYLAAQDNPMQLKALEDAVTRDPVLDDARKNTLIGRISARQGILETRIKGMQDRQEKMVERGLDTLDKNTMGGFPPTIEQFGPYIDAAKGNPYLESRVNQSIATANVMGNFTRMPSSQRAQMIDQATAALRGNTPKDGAPAVSREAGIELITNAIRDIGERSSSSAVSPQGATGTMQIMPATFKDYAKPGESYDNEADRVAAAKRKIADDYDFYKGDMEKVAAAYIGGRGAVRADGTIRDDVKDALGSTPAGYASKVTAGLKEANQAGKQARFDVSLLNNMKTMHEQLNAAMKEDGVTSYVRQGLIPVDSPEAKPIDVTKPEGMDTLQQRYSLAREISRRENVPFKPLTQPELNAATATLRSANKDQKAAFFGTLFQKSGNDMEGYKAIMQQVAKDEPVLAHAGVMAGRGRNVADAGVTPEAGQATKVADLILSGHSVLNPVKSEDGKSGGKTWPMPKETDMQKSFQGMEDKVFQGRPDMRNGYYQTVNTIYAGLSVQAGDTSGVIDSNRYSQAFKLATGGTYKNVILPWGNDESKFQDGISRRVDLMVKNGGLPQGVTPDQLKGAPLEMIRDGVYAPRTGSYQFLGKDGVPILFDFNKPLYDFDMADIEKSVVKPGPKPQAYIKPGVTAGVGPGQ